LTHRTPLSSPALAVAHTRRRPIGRALKAWAKMGLRHFPWREERTPYSVLLAEMLLRRTTSKAAASVFQDFLRMFPDTEALAKGDRGTLRSLLRKIGLQEQRTRALTEMAQYLLANHFGQIPSSRNELERVPHIGSYTAAAVRSFGFGIPDAVVDSNVMRIIRRLFAKSIRRRKLPTRDYERLAQELLPKHHQIHNFSLLDLGALVCRYDYPRCPGCPLRNFCDTGRPRSPSRRS